MTHDDVKSVRKKDLLKARAVRELTDKSEIKEGSQVRLYNKRRKEHASDRFLKAVYDDKIIHFGLKNRHTFIDHHDKMKRENRRKRHTKIKNKRGEYVYLLKSSPSFWSFAF